MNIEEDAPSAGKPFQSISKITITVIQGIDNPAYDGVTVRHDGEPLSLLRALGALEAAKHTIQTQLANIQEP